MADPCSSFFVFVSAVIGRFGLDFAKTWGKEKKTKVKGREGKGGGCIFAVLCWCWC
jgi:hypothetical protein